MNPRRAELESAYGTAVPDLVFAGMRVLLCGINPSLWSGLVGLHFGRPSNRLWPTLHQAEFTPRQLMPADIEELRAAGIGITNLVNRSTARADELDDDEIRAGRARLEQTARRWRPRAVAVLGVGAYRIAFAERKARVGRQPANLAGAQLWVLPNPSGLNAHYQQPDLTREFRALRETVK